MTRHCNFCYQEAGSCPALQAKVTTELGTTITEEEHQAFARQLICGVVQRKALEKHTNEVPKLD
jgi:hypothetical protein